MKNSKEKNLKKRHLESQSESSNNKKIEIEEKWLKDSLFEAIKNKNIEKTKTLLEDNKEEVTRIINQLINGVTFLHLSVANNDLELTNLLLKNGARPDSEDGYGDNCFHYSAKRGNLKMLRILAEYTKDETKSVINTHNQLGWSVLHNAATAVKDSDKNWVIIGWLLEQGADYNYKVNNRFSKGLSVENILSQKDWSYAENYRRIVEEFKKNELSEKASWLDFSFQDLVEGREELVSKLTEDTKKELENFLEIQGEVLKNPSSSFLKKQLELVKERLTKEMERVKKEERQKNDLTARLEVSPWNYFK